MWTSSPTGVQFREGGEMSDAEVDYGRVWRETRYANDASSVRIRLTAPPTPGGLPGVVVLKTCETGVRC